MEEFRKSAYRNRRKVVIPGNCVTLVSFDYKGDGDVTFTYEVCLGVIESSTHTLPNSGGDYQTYPADALVPNIPCFIEGTISASIVNVNNYVTTPGCL